MMSVYWLSFCLLLITIVKFQLSPDKVRLFRILFSHPPVAPFEQTFYKEIVIPFSKIEPVFIIRFDRVEVSQQNRVEDTVSKIDHENELAIVSNLEVIYREVSIVFNLSYRLLFYL